MKDYLISGMDKLKRTMPKCDRDSAGSCRELLVASRTSGTSNSSSSSSKQGSKLLTPMSSNLIAKKPKIIQRYLSILLKGSGDGKNENTRRAREALMHISNEVPKQRLFTVPNRFSEDLKNHPLAQNLSKHHIRNQVQVILKSNMIANGGPHPPASLSSVDDTNNNHSAKIRRGSGSRSSKSDSQQLIKREVPGGGVLSDDNKAGGGSTSMPRVAASQLNPTDMQPRGCKHATDAGVVSLQHTPPRDKTEVDGPEKCTDGQGNKEEQDQMEQYLKSKHVTSISTSHYPGLIMAPPGEKRVVQFPIGLSPEEAQQYIRLLIKAKRSSKGATTTPTAPYSSTDLIGSYNNDTNQFQDDLRIGNGLSHGGLETDRSERRRSRDFTTDRRPPSRKDSKKTIVITARESKGGADSSNDRQRDTDFTTTGIASVTSGNPTQKNFFKPLASRNSFVRNSIASPTPRPTTNGPTPNTETSPVPRATPLIARESEDTLVAMGTNWNPSNAFQRNNGRPGSFSNGMSNGNQGYHLAHQLSISQAPTTMSRQLAKRNTVPHLSNTRPSLRDGEPKYGDPTIGAPASFQQRLIEMSALESETIRWERTRKFQKKKPRSET